MRTFYDLVEKRFCDRANYQADRVHQTQLEAWGYLGTEAVMRELAGYIRAAQARVANWKAGVWDYMRDGKCQQLVLDADRSGVEAVAPAFLGMRPPEMKGNGTGRVQR